MENLKSFHVAGDMPTADRATQMREFAKGKGLMTNARCLTEGVDLPAIDCVCFTDPKRSKVDIVQAAGRALRLSKGKKFGYILIPIFIPAGADFNEAAEEQGFDDVAITVRALASSDTRIVEYLRVISSGGTHRGGTPVDGLTSANSLMKIEAEEFDKAIKLKVWDKIASVNYRTYEEAKKFASSQKIKSVSDWFKFMRTKKRPLDIPIHANTVYKESFEGWGIFLGTGRIADHLKIFRSFNSAREFARSLNLKNTQEWRNYSKFKKLPQDIPVNISNTYSKEFKGMPDFLGTNNVSSKFRKIPKFKELQNFAYKNKIKSVTEWFKFTKTEKFPKNFPKNVRSVYPDQWKSWGHFLKTGRVADQFKKWMPYDQAKKILKEERFKNVKEFTAFKKTKKWKILNIPNQPPTSYKNKGWKGWIDFLSLDTKHNLGRSIKKMSYEEAKKIVKKLNLKNQFEWTNFITNNYSFSLAVPRDAQRYYVKKNEWKGWPDFLGKKK